jgi:hypothetical protein
VFTAVNYENSIEGDNIKIKAVEMRPLKILSANKVLLEIKQTSLTKPP